MEKIKENTADVKERINLEDYLKMLDFSKINIPLKKRKISWFTNLFSLNTLCQNQLFFIFHYLFFRIYLYWEMAQAGKCFSSGWRRLNTGGWSWAGFHGFFQQSPRPQNWYRIHSTPDKSGFNKNSSPI